MEIIPNIHKIDGFRGANCYLISSGPEMVLVDAGHARQQQEGRKYLKEMGKNLSDIKYIFITHADIDHVGGAAEMKKMTGAKTGNPSG